MRLAITGEYPPDWKEISDRTWAEAGHRCVRCGHPYRKGQHGKGEWSPCDEKCTHGGPFGLRGVYDIFEVSEAEIRAFRQTHRYFARWRVATVHHADGNKSNCQWWNLLPLCQRCHLEFQGRVIPDTPYFLEHSDWYKPYVCGFYAWKYEGRQVTRDEAVARMPELLGYERRA